MATMAQIRRLVVIRRVMIARAGRGIRRKRGRRGWYVDALSWSFFQYFDLDREGVGEGETLVLSRGILESVSCNRPSPWLSE